MYIKLFRGYYITNFNKKQTDEALWHLEKIILNTLDFKDVVQRIVNDLLIELNYLKLGYRIIVLGLVDKNSKVLKRISISRTEEARKALEATPVPFPNIDIPLSCDENICIKALLTKMPMETNYWPDILSPVLTKEEAIKVQNIVGIKSSLIYPVIAKEEVLGILIFSLVKNLNEISSAERELVAKFTDIVGLAVQNSQLYTSLENAKNSLVQVNERLKELDRLKDDFVSLASHELRTPMTAIKSYLWMAIAGKGGPLNEKQMYYAQRSYTSVDRLIKLVNDMLNISRIESGRLTVQMKRVKIDQLVRETIEEVTPRAKELGVNVLTEQQEGVVPEVLADTDKIKEVLYNLIGNSMKFTPSGGKITVSFVQKDKMVEVVVKDTGSGIAEEDLPKLFQKFGILPGTYVTNQAVSGTGLGLYICRSLIELHGGKISASSEGKGKGTTFTFSLKVFNQEDLDKFREKYNNQIEEKVGLIHTQIS